MLQIHIDNTMTIPKNFQSVHPQLNTCLFL